jgi:hypothetical protein
MPAARSLKTSQDPGELPHSGTGKQGCRQHFTASPFAPVDGFQMARASNSILMFERLDVSTISAQVEIAFSQ